MSSVLRALSQPTPNKRYVTEGSGSGLIYPIDGSETTPYVVPANSVLRDMGKTVLIGAGGGTLLRKVQIIPVASGNLPYEYKTGYIYLENVPSGQNIVALN
jgi:hypothetical protein